MPEIKKTTAVPADYFAKWRERNREKIRLQQQTRRRAKRLQNLRVSPDLTIAEDFIVGLGAVLGIPLTAGQVWGVVEQMAKDKLKPETNGHPMLTPWAQADLSALSPERKQATQKQNDERRWHELLCKSWLTGFNNVRHIEINLEGVCKRLHRTPTAFDRAQAELKKPMGKLRKFLAEYDPDELAAKRRRFQAVQQQLLADPTDENVQTYRTLKAEGVPTEPEALTELKAEIVGLDDALIMQCVALLKEDAELAETASAEKRTEATKTKDQAHKALKRYKVEISYFTEEQIEADEGLVNPQDDKWRYKLFPTFEKAQEAETEILDKQRRRRELRARPLFTGKAVKLTASGPQQLVGSPHHEG